MKKGYNLICWGIVLTGINIYIGYFNIVPNFIGYGLIGVGLSTIFEKFKFDTTLKPEAFAYLLALASFLFDFLVWFTTGLYSSFALKSAQIIIFLILEFILFYLILESLITLNKLEEQFEVKLRRYTIFALMTILISGLIILYNDPFALLLSAAVLLIVKLYVVLFIQDIKNSSIQSS